MSTLRASRTLVIAAGVLAVAGGFLPFSEGSSDVAWSDIGIAAAPNIYGALAAILTILTAAKFVRGESAVLGIRLSNVVAVLGAASTLIIVSFLWISSTYETTLGLGFWVTLVGSVGVTLGAVAEDRAIRTSSPAASTAAPKRGLRPDDLLVLVAGVALVAACVTHHVELSDIYGFTGPGAPSCASETAGWERTTCLAVQDGWINVWSELSFPLAAWPVVAGLAAAAVGIAGRLRRHRTRNPLLAASGTPAMLAAASTGALVQVWWFPEGTPQPGTWGIAFWLTNLGLAALLVAAIADLGRTRPIRPVRPVPNPDPASGGSE